ncbi:MAG: tetratricopeptide repeat protein [Alphaproteobacteria bacterium]|nr:tetratricopeptide repeat protein [Alphaproteobacteria bacterium]
MTTAEQTGSLQTALAHAGRMLQSDPAVADAQCAEILRVMPDQPDALFLRALALAAQDKSDEAIAVLKHTVTRYPAHAQAWRALGDQYTFAGDTQKADAAYARHLRASVNDPRLREAGAALCDNKLAVAERILRGFLKENPTDVAAIRMLAEVGARLGRYKDAENLLARALELAPSFAAARHNYASVLHRQSKAREALEQADILLKADPRNPGFRAMRAAALAQLGEYEEAARTYDALLKQFPSQPKLWMSYGHTLKTLGQTHDSIAAYRKAIAQMPGLGEAWWSLANLKTLRFEDDEIATMRKQLARGDLSVEDRFHLEFALGKALEDSGVFDAAFAHYAEGNAQRRKTVHYSADETSEFTRRSRALFTRDFFATHEGMGAGEPDPIFIVGLPRSGSTLLEQILSSHSQVEGTMELPDITALARRLGERTKKSEVSRYPDVLAELSADEVKALGEEYLSRTRIHRKLGRPFFIDKLPNNFQHTGFIHLILPRAKIIDARRHPLGCGFSCFKQHFARGQSFTYNLEDLGRYYRDYVELMAHYDAVLPGRVQRVIYEDMVADPEAEVRRLLAYCGLAFEEGCLKFYENARAVRTASSEQVRQPIYSDATDHWRNFEPWLADLKASLGPVLDSYPHPPVLS